MFICSLVSRKKLRNGISAIRLGIPIRGKSGCKGFPASIIDVARGMGSGLIEGFDDKRQEKLLNDGRNSLEKWNS
jgi:hypothetical protein